MKVFLRKTILFLLAPFLLLAVLLVVFYVNDHKKLSAYRIPAGITIAIMGDSHIQLCFNDSLFPGSTNLSQKSESFKYTLLKLKMLAQKNPALKTVYLGVSYHSFSSYFDDFLYGKNSVETLAKYFFISPVKEKEFQLKQNSDQVSRLVKSLVVQGYLNAFSNTSHNDFMGYYENNFNNKFAEEKLMDKRILLQFYKDGQLRGFADRNIEYLKELIRFCAEKNILLITINTPLHPYYKSKIPFVFIDRYNSFIRENKLRSVELGDVSADTDYFLPDGDHVSRTGAAQTTLMLKKINDSLQHKL